MATAFAPISGIPAALHRAEKDLPFVEYQEGVVRRSTERFGDNGRTEPVAEEQQGSVPVARNVCDPGRTVPERAAHVRCRRAGRSRRRGYRERNRSCQHRRPYEIPRPLHVDLP